jgi:hypothetical protein
MIRKTIIVLITFALLAMGGSSARAAADITRPGSCSVSANWTINLSVNFNNTHGSPSRGVVDYVVLNSPGPIQPSGSDVNFYNVAGQFMDQSTDWLRDFSKPGYVYRMDPELFGLTDEVRRVVIDPFTTTLVSCSDYSSHATIYSAN